MNSYLPGFLHSLIRDMFFRKLSFVASQKEFSPSKFFPRNPTVVHHPMLLPEQWFNRMLSLERKRTERSRVPFLLMSMSIDGIKGENDYRSELADRIVTSIVPLTRETDIFGWRVSDSVLGVIFTSIGDVTTPATIVEPIRSKIVQELSQQLGTET